MKYIKSRLKIDELLLVFAALLMSDSVRAGCDAISLDGPRDDKVLVESVKECANEKVVTDASKSALLGYAFRHGYGMPRSSEAARSYYLDALSVESCEAFAVCGLKGLSESQGIQNCQIECSSLFSPGQPDKSESTEFDSGTRAHQLLQEILRQDPTLPRNINELKAALSELLEQDRQLLNSAYQELCTGHIKRAVVTVSVAHQLDREMRRRDKLIEHHQGKVEKDGNAKSQATLTLLRDAQRRSDYDKRVFFNKYAKAVFAASNCDVSALDESYKDFEREIAEVKVTDLEQRAYRLFRKHVGDAKDGQGMNSTWFDKLDDLLIQQ